MASSATRYKQTVGNAEWFAMFRTAKLLDSALTMKELKLAFVLSQLVSAYASKSAESKLRRV